MITPLTIAKYMQGVKVQQTQSFYVLRTTTHFFGSACAYVMKMLYICSVSVNVFVRCTAPQMRCTPLVSGRTLASVVLFVSVTITKLSDYENVW